MSEVVRQFTVAPDDEGIRLDRWFKRHLPDIGFATISRWARTGQIRVDGKRADPADRLVAGQVLRVPPGGTRNTCPAASRSSGAARLPSTRICPVRAQRETMAKPTSGKWRLNQRSRRTPSSSCSTVNRRTVSLMPAP